MACLPCRGDPRPSRANLAVTRLIRTRLTAPCLPRHTPPGPDAPRPTVAEPILALSRPALPCLSCRTATHRAMPCHPRQACLARPSLAGPRLTRTSLTTPAASRPAVPTAHCQAVPRLPRRAIHRLAQPSRACHTRPCLTMSHPAEPCRAQPSLACRVEPRRALRRRARTRLPRPTPPGHSVRCHTEPRPTTPPHPLCPTRTSPTLPRQAPRCLPHLT
jgi:hypothetical protein